MPAARYWRVVGIKTYGGVDLELSELHLYDVSGRVDASATLTSAIAPISGALANLKDDVLGTTCRFAASAARSPGFALVWDFGSGDTRDVIGVRIGSAASESRFVEALTIEYGSDGTSWSTLHSFSRYPYPGDSAFTEVPTEVDTYENNVVAGFHFDGSNGSNTFYDTAGVRQPQTHGVVTGGGPRLSTLQKKFGSASLVLDGGYFALGATADPDLAPGASDFCIEAWCYDAGSGARRVLFGNAEATGTGATLTMLVTTSNTIDSTAQGAVVSGVVAPVDVWYHYAFVRNGNTLTVYIDGVAQGTTTISGSVAAGSGQFSVGAAGNYTTYGGSFGTMWMGYVDDFRYTIGAARYTANFTPPTTQFASLSNGLLPPLLLTLRGGFDIFIDAPLPVGMPITPVGDEMPLFRDFEFGGFGRIAGTVKKDASPDIPVKRCVRLHREQDGMLVREVWSDPTTGAYSFDYIDATKQYTVITYDYLHDYRAVIADNITPEAMP